MTQYITAKSFNRLQEAIIFFQTNDMRDFKVMHTDFDKEKDEFTAMVHYHSIREREYPRKYRYWEEANNYVFTNFTGLRKHNLNRHYNGCGWVVKQVAKGEDIDKALLCCPVDTITFDEIYQIA